MKQRFLWVGCMLLMATLAGCDLDPVRYDGSLGGQYHIKKTTDAGVDGGVDGGDGVDDETEEAASDSEDMATVSNSGVSLVD